jgi:DNA-directed RNA polymerase subunit K/omega
MSKSKSASKVSTSKSASKVSTSKSASKVSTSKSASKVSTSKSASKTTKEVIDIPEELPILEEEDDINYTADDEEFFNEKNFQDFATKIKFHIFDPEKYENEIHREINIIPSNFRKTSEIMTKFEFTEVVSHRAKQIENGGKIYTDVKDESDLIKMAEMEIRMRRCPLSIRRLLSHNLAEIWEVNEMVCIH